MSFTVIGRLYFKQGLRKWVATLRFFY